MLGQQLTSWHVRAELERLGLDPDELARRGIELAAALQSAREGQRCERLMQRARRVIRRSSDPEARSVAGLALEAAARAGETSRAKVHRHHVETAEACLVEAERMTDPLRR